MAKRRKQYRGTPEEHRFLAVSAASNFKRTLKDAKRKIANGDCRGALDSITSAGMDYGILRTHLRNAQPLRGKAATRISRTLRAVHGPRQSGSAAKLVGLERAYYRACVQLR